MKYVKIYNARDDIEARMIIDILEQNGIISYCLDKSSGQWMSITQGFSVYGKDIVVSEDNEKSARELISEILNAEVDWNEVDFSDGEESEGAYLEGSDNEQIGSESDISDNAGKYPWYRSAKVIARIEIGFVVLVIIAAVIFGLIYGH